MASACERAGAKLLAGGKTSSLTSVVLSACPKLDVVDAKAVARTMVSGNSTMPAVAQPVSGGHQHVVVGHTKAIASTVCVETNVAPQFGMAGICHRDVPLSVLEDAGLHVISRTSNSLVVRPRSELNVTNSRELVAALKTRGLSGALLESVYAEYPSACVDIHSFGREVVCVDGLRVWHASVATCPVPGALARWRRYKSLKKQHIFI